MNCDRARLESSVRTSVNAQPKHIPYAIDPGTNRAHFYENHWKRVALDLLLRRVTPAGQRVLDYGCGRGETLEMFKAAGFEVTGTDTDPECVRLAGRFGPAEPLRPGEAVAQFGAKSFDIVTCFHVLEHVENPAGALREIAAIAKDYVLLAVPNLRNLQRMFTRRIERDLINEGHLHAWDHWHLLNLAERYCGLELVEWGFDATQLSGLSELSQRVLGTRATIALETGLFRKMFPYHGISVLGLFKVKSGAPSRGPETEAPRPPGS